MTIGENPLSRNLAKFLGYYKHLKAGSKQASRGFRPRLEKIHEKIKSKYPGGDQDQCKPDSIIAWMRGRPCKFDSVRKIAEAINVNPYDFYVDSARWINVEKLTETHKEIIELLKQITKSDNLNAIKSVVTISARDELLINSNEIQNHNCVDNNQ